MPVSRFMHKIRFCRVCYAVYCFATVTAAFHFSKGKKICMCCVLLYAYMCVRVCMRVYDFNCECGYVRVFLLCACVLCVSYTCLDISIYVYVRDR